jgi:hypothetical protein
MVFAEDLERDDLMFDNKFMTSAVTDVATDDVNGTTEFNYSIPQTFTSPKLWIKSTGLKCWNCDRFFKNPPLFIVEDVANIDSVRTITTIGNFCTDNCAISYINANYKGTERDDKTKYQIMLARERTGKNITIIKPAPPKTIMKAYCGSNGITPEEYEQRLNELSTDFSLTTYKIDQLSSSNIIK